MSRRTELVRHGADVIEALANVLAPVAVLEHRLRLLAHALRDDDNLPARIPSSRRRFRSTVEFSDLDAARADRALARLGVRGPR